MLIHYDWNTLNGLRSYFFGSQLLLLRLVRFKGIIQDVIS